MQQGMDVGSPLEIHTLAFNVRGWHNVPLRVKKLSHRGRCSSFNFHFGFQPQIGCFPLPRFASRACVCVSSNTLHMVCAGTDVNACGLHCLLCCKLCGGTQISDMHDVILTHVTAGSVPHTRACAFSHTQALRWLWETASSGSWANTFV